MFIIFKFEYLVAFIAITCTNRRVSSYLCAKLIKKIKNHNKIEKCLQCYNIFLYFCIRFRQMSGFFRIIMTKIIKKHHKNGNRT